MTFWAETAAVASSMAAFPSSDSSGSTLVSPLKHGLEADGATTLTIVASRDLSLL